MNESDLICRTARRLEAITERMKVHRNAASTSRNFVGGAFATLPSDLRTISCDIETLAADLANHQREFAQQQRRNIEA